MNAGVEQKPARTLIATKQQKIIRNIKRKQKIQNGRKWKGRENELRGGWEGVPRKNEH